MSRACRQDHHDKPLQCVTGSDNASNLRKQVRVVPLRRVGRLGSEPRTYGLKYRYSGDQGHYVRLCPQRNPLRPLDPPGSPSFRVTFHVMTVVISGLAEGAHLQRY